MTEIERLLAQSVAIQHVLWAADAGFEPMEVLRSVRAYWTNRKRAPNWLDVVAALTKAWPPLTHSASANVVRLAA